MSLCCVQPASAVFLCSRALVLLVSLCASQAWAQTAVSGAIAGDTQWTVSGGPYLISGSALIQNGAVLTIDAGVSIYMGTGAALTVQAGAIKAQGTAANPIRVVSDRTRLGAQAAPGDWDRWVFSAGTVNTQLEHVLFENGRGLVVNGSAPVFNYLELRNHQGAAITIDLAASPSGVGNQASGNTLNGIAVPAGDITGSVNWTLRGIPYVVSSGAVSVGGSPATGAITPSSLEQGHTVTVNITGSRLTGLAEARFDAAGLSAQILPGGTSTLLILSVSAAATAPAGASGLTLLVDSGEIRIPLAITVERALPVIASLDPVSVVSGQGALDVTVNGRNFTSQSAVLINGNPVATQCLSATQLRTTLANQGTPGNLLFSVRTPDLINVGQLLVSDAVNFPVVSAQLTLSPLILSAVKGASQTLTLTLPYAAPAGGISIDLASSAPAASATSVGRKCLPLPSSAYLA
jgi:hypothetical protein